MKNSHSLNVPTALGIWVAENDFEKPFRLYLAFLMMFRDGKVILEKQHYVGIAYLLGYKSPKTVKNNIKKLLNKGWFTYNRATGYLMIVGLDSLHRRYKLGSRLSVEVIPEMLNDIYALVGVLVYTKLWKNIEWNIKTGEFERIKWRSFKDSPYSIKKMPTRKSQYLPISVLGVNKWFPKISIAKAERLKQRAFNFKLIHKRSCTIKISDHKEDIHTARKCFPNCFVKKGKVYLREPDLIKLIVQLRRRRKREK